MSHIHFILAFINSWWGPNFSWHKRIDPKTNVNGFLARHLPVHFYIQHRDLQTLRDNWAANPEFNKFIEMFPENDEYSKEELASKLLNKQ